MLAYFPSILHNSSVLPVFAKFFHLAQQRCIPHLSTLLTLLIFLLQCHSLSYLLIFYYNTLLGHRPTILSSLSSTLQLFILALYRLSIAPQLLLPLAP
jgi:hypothetical protein